MQAKTEQAIKIREATDDDINELISLIDNIFDEYDMEFIPEDELPDFVDFKNHYNSQHELLVAEHKETGLLAGCTALKFEEKAPRLSRVYVRKKDRGKGIGKMLVREAEKRARKRGSKVIHLWTDTRFERAHTFYKNLGYTYTGRVKPLNDINNSYEYHFFKRFGKEEVDEAV